MWHAYAISLLGLYLIAAPCTFSQASSALFYSDVISGLLLLILGWLARRAKFAAVNWCLLAMGLWLQIAPLLFWAPAAAGYLNDTLVGVWVIVLAFVVIPLPNKSFQNFSSIPPGWSYNPSAWPQRLPVAFFAFICWMISRYLAAYQLGYIDTIWDPVFAKGTLHVLNSDVSKAFPVSDAGLGAFAYTCEFIATIQGDTARWRTSPWMVVIFGVLVIPVSLTSIILIILQPLVVGSWCFLCLITAFCMLLPTGFAVDEVLAVYQYMKKVKPEKRLYVFFHGGDCFDAREDTRSPAMDAPLSTLVHASRWGVTFPWNLSLCALLGVCLMMSPYVFSLMGWLEKLDPILGALTIVVAITAYGEMVRKIRYLMAVFAVAILVLAWLTLTGSALFSHIIIALLLIGLCLRKGPIREKFHLG